MKLTFLLSGEHPTIPPAEVCSAIEVQGSNFEKIEELDQVLVVESDADPRELSRRLGMTHWIGENFGVCDPDILMDVIASSDLIDFLPQSESIAVRVKRIKNHLSEIDTQGTAEKVADWILGEYDYEVDLEHPENEVVILLTEDECVVSVLRAEVDRSGFEDRSPSKRAAEHPTTMQPNLARAMVNLARTPGDGKFLDPFCGIGGILIEAGLVGAEVIGADINSEMLSGARENLKENGLRSFELIEKDARNLDVDGVDAIATDPPYGRQSSTGGSDPEDIYRDIFPVFADILPVGRYLCIGAPSEVDLEKISSGLPFDLQGKHSQRVHKSLLRNIYVFEREKS